MDNSILILKAIANETRLKIVKLLLQHNYCVSALARLLGLTEAAISQHLKILREAGLIFGKKQGYFKHYHVSRVKLHTLASQFEELAAIQKTTAQPPGVGCGWRKKDKCSPPKPGQGCSSKSKFTCRSGKSQHRKGDRHRYCNSH